MATKRKGLSKKIRFEVFKRDRFTCQYCGSQAPQAILVVDHVRPVASGGKNDLINLITSCVACNAGKGARELSDDAVLVKQRAELERLAERREQISMMAKWAEEAANTTEHEVDAVVQRWLALVPGWNVNEGGRANIRKWVRKIPLPAILSAVQTAVEQHVGANVTEERVNHAFDSIPGIARVQSLPKHEQDLYYIRGIVRRRVGCGDEVWALQILRRAHAAGAEIQDLRDVARQCYSWNNWCNLMDDLMRGLAQ